MTLRETALVLEGVIIVKKLLKGHLEAMGYRDAFPYAHQFASDKTAISPKAVKDIHSLVLMDRPDDKGVYHSAPVRIIGACEELPQPRLVSVQVGQLAPGQKTEKRLPLSAATGERDCLRLTLCSCGAAIRLWM